MSKRSASLKWSVVSDQHAPKVHITVSHSESISRPNLFGSYPDRAKRGHITRTSYAISLCEADMTVVSGQRAPKVHIALSLSESISLNYEVILYRSP